MDLFIHSIPGVATITVQNPKLGRDGSKDPVWIMKIDGSTNLWIKTEGRCISHDWPLHAILRAFETDVLRMYLSQNIVNEHIDVIRRGIISLYDDYIRSQNTVPT